ncbi:MAG: glucosaminidase domain-containing protein, partial [Solobacterium sp.]|nr:glucosaminidase domain-containing protein [Solobacterium sp.]
DHIYHEIKSDMVDDNYTSIINGGIAPTFLEKGKTYYSYDGHYFYADSNIKEMIDDYRASSREHSINPNDPHYDYYQFISHRTLTNADVKDVERYFDEIMGITNSIDRFNDDDKDAMDDTLTRSQYYHTEDAFWQYQYEYGSNALMMLAISAQESGYGRSSLSFTRNNLFGHAAFDTEEESSTSRYLSVENSIYSHAKYYISGSFSSPLKSQYHGSFFGNKSSGMNVGYTTDPYWGEKAAAFYRTIDEWVGSEDFQTYTLGIKTSEDSIFIYQFPEIDAKVLYDSGKNPDMAFVLLDTIVKDDQTWYKIQCDATLNEDSAVDLSYDYDFANDIGYIHADDIQMILNGRGKDLTYHHVEFDANGGTFTGGASSIIYAIPNGYTAIATSPTKENALFTGWDKETTNISSDTTFVAQYKDVDHIEMKEIPQQDYEENDRINLKGGKVEVYYKDGTSEEFVLTSSMVSGYNLEQDGNQEVIVHYAGCTTSYPITVSAEKDHIRTEIKQEILEYINQYGEIEEFDEATSEKIIALKEKIDENVLPYLTHAQLRNFDTIVRKAINNRVRYVIDKNSYNLGVSGLSISAPLGDSLEKPSIVADTYRVRISEGISKIAEEELGKKASFLENDIKESFTINLKKNYEDFHLDGPILFSIDKPENSEEGEVFSVLYYDQDDGDIVKCYTRQTGNSVTFMGKGSGEYMVVSRRTSNEYAGNDPEEAVTASTESFDLEAMFVKIAIASIISLLILLGLLFIFLMGRKKKVKEKRIEKEEKKKKEDSEPSVKEAIDKFETEMLKLEDIKLESDKQDSYIFKKRKE